MLLKVLHQAVNTELLCANGGGSGLRRQNHPAAQICLFQATGNLLELPVHGRYLLRQPRLQLSRAPLQIIVLEELLKLKDILVCQDLLGTEEAQEDNLLARDLRIL